MRLLFVNDKPYLPQLHGGVEWNTHELCLALPKYDVTPFVVCTVVPGTLLGVSNRIKSRLGLWGRAPADALVGYKVYRGWNTEPELEDVFNRINPDRIVVQGTTPSLIKRFRSITPASFYIHMIFNASFDDYSGYQSILACSDYAKDHYKESLPNTRIVRPLVNPNRCRVSRDQPGDSVLFFGLSLLKGADIVLHLAQLCTDIKFIMVRTWTDDLNITAQILSKARQLPNVTVLEPTNNIKELFVRARVLLVPSRCPETFGRVVVEAQLNGIPVLASDRGNLLNTVGKGGICIDPDYDIECWASKLRELMKEDRLYERLSGNALEYSRRPELSEDYIIQSLLDAIG
jgi:glycosyltransferase involved in cell wall biosynthesis